MKVYRNATIITAVLTIFSFFAALLLNFYIQVDPFWCNALLGVFGSSLLTLLTSIIGYRVERRKTFEGFSYTTKAILHDLNKYQTLWSLDEKIEYFLNYHDVSKVDWDKYFGDFCFMIDYKQKNRKYIYTKIYTPILKINQAINSHVWHFRWYKDGSGRNDRAVGKFIEEIESLIIEVSTETCSISPTDSESKVIMTSTKNKIVCNIQSELNERYYRLMYGKKTYMENCAED